MRKPFFAQFLALCLILMTVTPAAAQQVERRELGDLFGDMMGLLDPMLSDLAEMLGDLSGWHAPEFLDNGDILIRRRQPDVAPETSPDTPPASEDEPPVTDPLEL